MGLDVSVVIPTWNRKKLVSRALRSVQAQTLEPREILVIDDGSTDGTAQELRRDFSSVHVLSQARAGVAAARNRGIEEAQGEWIAFLDSDDEWTPQKLQAQRDVLANRSGLRLCHTEETWIREGVRVNPPRRYRKQEGRIFRHCLDVCAMAPSAVLVHRSLFDEVGVFDETFEACEDYDLWLRICAHHQVGLVSTPSVIRHGGHEDQLSATVPSLDRFRVRALEKILSDPELSPEDREAAREVLIAKLSILAKGAQKRGKHAEARDYGSRLEAWSQSVEKAP